MKILAFLQNQWFLNPARAQQTYDRHPDLRHRLNARYLFAGCLSGRRLQAAFGSDLCDQIIWENASPRIASQADGVFPADPAHMAAAIARHNPDVILLLGSIARGGFHTLSSDMTLRPQNGPFHVIDGPHPAARGGTVTTELQSMAGLLKEIAT